MGKVVFENLQVYQLRKNWQICYGRLLSAGTILNEIQSTSNWSDVRIASGQTLPKEQEKVVSRITNGMRKLPEVLFMKPNIG